MTVAQPPSVSEPMSHDVGRLGRSDVAAGTVEFISIAIGGDQYGVDIMSVREIKEWEDVRPLPRQPEYMRGVRDLRGVVVPIIDLRCRFGQGLTECTPTHVIVIVQMDDRQIGLLADQVLDIVSFEQSEIQPIPSVGRTSRTRFLSGLVTVEGAMIALIDLARLLADDADSEEAAASQALDA